MLDIKFIRENKDLVQEGARKKHVEFSVADLLDIDDHRKELLVEVEDMRAKQNKVTNEIRTMIDTETREKRIAEMKTLKTTLHKKEEDLRGVMAQWQTLML